MTGGGGGGIKQQEHAARRPAADARRPALPRQRVRHRAAGDRHIRVVVVQQARRHATAPVGQRLQQPLGQRVGAEDAAVEQHRVRQRGVRRQVLLQEAGELARDGRVARVRQAELDQPAMRPPRRLVPPDPRKEAIDQQRPHLIARQVHRLRLADQARAAAEQRHGHPLRRVRGEQLLLGDAAAGDELRQPRARQRRRRATRHCPARRRGQPPLDEVRQRQVHVVAAEHQVLADGAAAQAWQPARLVRRADVDQREVGRPAAHVAHQHAPHAVQRRGQRLAVAEEPVLEGGLRLLHQRQRRQARQPRGLQRQRPRRLVEGRGHGEHDGLLVERRVGVGVVPGGADVGEVGRTGLDRRDLGNAVVRAPGEDGREAVGAGVREPALGAADEAAGHLRAELAGAVADEGGGVARVVRQLAGRRVVAHGRQQRAGRPLAGTGPLGDVEQGDLGTTRAGAGHHGVRGAQVDADEEGAGNRHQTRISRPRSGRACRTRPSSARCRRWGRQRVRACRPR
jgi:hypothetical protein